ncbi:MAG: zinc ribbon domain-containing protein [Clostridiales bacterium]|nr:zinc ribbon domain-containing protein [Clostridiales bacterium]
MRICTNCKKELPDNALFCDGCGAKVEQEQDEMHQETPEQGNESENIFCPFCGKSISSGYEFCPECGSNILQQIKTGKQNGSKKFSLGKRGKKISAILLGLVVVIGIGLGIIFLVNNSGKDCENQLLYVKKNKLLMTDSSEDEPIVLSKNLINIENNVDDIEDSEKDDVEKEKLDFDSMVNASQQYITTYKDENRIVYPDRMSSLGGDTNTYCYSLYYRSLSDVDNQSEKIDSGIEGPYQVTEDGKRIFYKKDSDLYVYDFEEKEKIAKDIKMWETSDDGSKIYYTTNDGELYQITSDGQKKRVDKDLENGGIIRVYNTGEVYYTIVKEEQRNVLDYVENDVFTGEIEKPECPEEPEGIYREDFDSDKAYEKAEKKYEKEYEEWENAYDEYCAAYDAYEQAEEWSAFMKDIQQAVFSVPVTYFYYYNGENTKEIGSVQGDEVGYWWSGEWYCDAEWCDEKAELIYPVIDSEDISKLKLSEYEEDVTVDEIITDLEDMFEGYSEDYYVDYKFKLAVGGACYDLDWAEGEIDSVQFNSVGNCVTYLENEDLKQIKIIEEKPQKPITYDRGVYDFASQENETDAILYTKKVDEEEFELYINKKKIDNLDGFNDVWCYSTGKDETFYYYKDWDKDAMTGTLMAYERGKVSQIASDVRDVLKCADENVYYMKDYDVKEGFGSVYYLKNDKPVKVVDDAHDFCVLADGTFYYLKDYDSDEGVSDLYLYQKNGDKLIDSNVQMMVSSSAVEVK